ncbi:histidine phosphatase family protein [Deinococcus psychrotolerans]|uniref:Histidine phosphatase family protein n=1 Tax=Deinococcus psychrotolerans TaxID=2489213 RepID=A0A3G8YBE5_9DEIO|nr:histidine phosphatase family protein [Deinococcus psychrotolerans]AZI42250.1 histidine phosphatase family protein [Deinococcus psychrotolerans]
MSQLLLIRHGQATPFEADTDRLSELGERQARQIGKALHAEHLGVTHLIHGPLVRQRRTALLAAEGLNWPTPQEDDRLAEYDGDGLLRWLAPLLAERDAEFAERVQKFEREKNGPQRNKYLQAVFEPLTDAYLRGELQHPEVESWAEFGARVQSAMRDVLRLPGATVLVFTSGGVIGSVVAGVLKAPPETALALNWRIKNGSITRLTYGGGRVSLDSFNETAHLGELQSWR